MEYLWQCMQWGTSTGSHCWGYRLISNISRTLVGNTIVGHSDVVGASPVGAAPTIYSFSFETPGFNGLGRDNCQTRRETLKCWDLVLLIIDVWWYHPGAMLCGQDEIYGCPIFKWIAVTWRWPPPWDENIYNTHPITRPWWPVMGASFVGSKYDWDHSVAIGLFIQNRITKLRYFTEIQLIYHNWTCRNPLSTWINLNPIMDK